MAIKGSGIFVFVPQTHFSPPSCWCVFCVLCSWKQTRLSTFGKETRSNTRVRWQMLHHRGSRPCCPLPGTWTVSPTARTGRAITRPTHRISRVRLHYSILIGETPPLPSLPSPACSLLVWFLSATFDSRNMRDVSCRCRSLLCWCV